jgi:hypothetical protein
MSTLLPVVSEQTRQELERLVQQDADAWKRQMIHHLKEDNPEINTLLLEIAKQSADAKQVILAGYIVYKALEMAHEEETSQALSLTE